MKSWIAIAFALILIGCAPSRGWRPDAMYTETSTYDGGQSLYQEVGVTGQLTDNVRMDVFGVTYLSTRGESHEWGGGVRFAFPLGYNE